MVKYLLLFCFVTLSIFSWGQTLTTTRISSDDATSPLIGGSTGRVILAISIDKTAGATDFTNLVISTGTTDPNTIFSSVELWTSATNFSAATNTNATVTLNSSNITFAGNPTNLFSYGAGAITGRKFYLVATVRTDVPTTTAGSPSVTLSLTETATTYTGTPTETAFSLTGTTYNFEALTADFTQNTDDDSALSGEVDVTLLDFTVNSNGTQTISPNLVFTFSTDVTDILENWDLQIDGSNVPGTEVYTLNGAGTELTISGFTGVNVTNATNFQLFADIKGTATSSDDFIISLTPTGVTIAPGVSEAFGIFSNTIDVTGLEADFTQNADDATAFADQNGVKLLDFTVNSNGTQTISPNLIFNFNKDVTNILENWNLHVGGANIPGTEIYTLNGAGTQLTISGFSGVNVTNATNFQLFADIKAGATISDDFTISLIPAGITISPGVSEDFGTFSNSIDIIISQASDIILNGSTTTSIAYQDYQEDVIGPDFTGSTNLGDYIIRDGGATNDGDNKGMTITSISIQFTNAQNLRQVALFDDITDTEIPGTQETVSGTGTITIAFTPTTPIQIVDDGEYEFKVRASFKSTVTDKQPIQISIVSAIADASGSGFSSVGSWASTQTASNTNVIAVVATKFVVNFSPTSQAINAPFTITVQAVDDDFENRDLDYTGKINLTRSPSGGTFTATQGFTGQSLSAGQFTWTNAQFSVSNNYTITANDNPHAGDNGVNLENGQRSITISSSASTITQGTTTPVTICYGNSFFPLNNIVIVETDPAGISGSNGTYTFSLSLPTGFVFDQSVLTGVSATGGSDITIPASPHYTYPSPNTVQFSYTLAGTANTNTITISGLKVGRPHPGNTMPGNTPPTATGNLDITRTGGTANIAGVLIGADLGTVSASQQNGAINFTVAAISGGLAVDPNTTTFNVNSPAVNLIGSASTGTSIFSGSGVTSVGLDYRFNPSSLSAADYNITYTHTNTSGCQSQFTKTFKIITSGIANLNTSYCTTDAPSPNMSVSEEYINDIMGSTGWSVDRFVYLDLGSFSWVPITSPSNERFDPSLQQYYTAYLISKQFGLQGLYVGFSVCKASSGIPCNGTSNIIATYQVVEFKVAPDVNFDLPNNLYKFCHDNAPIVLTGSPANSLNTTIDNFSASGGQGAAISHSIVSGNEVWTLSPNLVTGVTTTTSQTFNITYRYQDPVTSCFNVSTKPITVHFRPTGVPDTDITKTQPGTLPPDNTIIQLCQNNTNPFYFEATNPDYTYRWYSSPLPIAESNLKTTGNTFNPAISTSTASTNTFYVTREKNGCESTNAPLALTVSVIASPVAPSPNLPNENRQYCVGGTINSTDLAIPTGGNTIRWYNSTTGALVHTGGAPTVANLGIVTTAPIVYSFNVTQTESTNNCEGPPAVVTVTVKALPSVLISAPGFDATKICTTGGDVKFVATDQSNPDQPASNGIWSATGLSGALNPFPLDGAVQLFPLNRLPGTYTLEYDYENEAGCSNVGSLQITILPTITQDINVSDVCYLSPAVITNNSTINNGAGQNSTIVTASWAFGDGRELTPGNVLDPIDPVIHEGRTTGTYLNPQHIYSNTGTFQIGGTLTTSDGCVYTIPQRPVTVSPLPVANFTSTNVCVNSETTFQASADITIQTYEWNFSKNNLLDAGTSISASNEVKFTYTQTGRDTVVMIATTPLGCKDIVEKSIYSLPKYQPIKDAAYTQDFTSADGWITGGKNSTWTLAIPAAAPQPIGGNAWVTGYDKPEESSWVLSGCFDFTDVTKPVISLDIWSDVSPGADGAVLQYNKFGNIEDNVPGDINGSDGLWERVGEVGQGINWYDDQGISNNPGNQSTTSAGWTGRYDGWKRSIYKLDEVAGLSNVVFRIAFASAQPRGTGFVFDNVFVGERNRIVLIENFTNTSLASSSAHNSAFQNFGNVVVNGELVKIQYHTAFPGNDPVNSINQPMNNSRAAFYGITQAPTARLDGGFKTGVLSNWLQGLYDDRVLTPSAVNLNATATQIDGEVKINISIENLTTQPLSLAGAHVFVTIVKKSILKADNAELFGNTTNTEFVYVAQKMLPNAAGTPIVGNIQPGVPYQLNDITWSQGQGDAIVIFLQNIDGNNKDVYQAILLDSPPVPSDIITGSEDPEYTKRINLYPNPANTEVHIDLPAAVTKPTPVAVIDTYGRTVYQATFKVGEKSKTVPTTTLADGMYLMQIALPQGGTAVRKVMVKH